ncbi:PAS domain S-box protein [Candidatus Reidiella endopervernicosa]|uniref:PAS domain S-box protein n=1 Tax=Candidatus Reidiella endopervernicosa TaxID=2738883 RepID=A0A6N0HZ36_9GAMM|nr:PAS domain S-box protein [Candidatus Reidiella endopervernicosa]
MVSFRDITERKRVEEDLRLAASAFESHEAITITDPNGVVLRVNEAFTSITGYTAEEIVGKHSRVLSSGQQSKAFYRKMWQVLLEKGVWEGEIVNRRKDGEAYPEWLGITAVKNEAGETTHYVGHFQDITERKRAASKIERQAYYDALTDLPNRRFIYDQLQKALSRCKRHGHTGALLFLDVDHFKVINDSLGH